MKSAAFLSVAAVAALLLSGCFGYPAGSAKPGDTVTVRYTALDAIGAVAASKTSSFVIGSGSSGLGLDVERFVLGLTPNSTATVASPASARGYDSVVEAPQEFQRDPIVQSYPAADFTKQVDTPVVDMMFPAFGYNATMLSVTSETVTFRLESKDGARNDFPQYGLSLVYRTEGDQRVKTLEPTAGVTFTIAYANQIALQCFDAKSALAPCAVGSYQVMEAKGGHLRFGYFPGTDRTLLGKALTFQITLLSIHAGAPLVAPEGQYGVRSSPQVLGDVSSFLEGTATTRPSHTA